MSVWLADGVALLHGAVVLYVGGGLVLLLLGLWRKWSLARHFTFRYSHLALVLFINVFEWADQPCPLTTIEKELRAQDAYPGGFIARHVHDAIHVELPPRALAWPTLGLLGAVVALYVLAPPVAAKTVCDETLSRGPPALTVPPLARGAWVLVLASLPPALYWLADKAAHASVQPWDHRRAGFRHVFLFFLAAGVLCALQWKKAGLGLGSAERWQRHALKIAFVWALPPLAVALVYANLSEKPFQHHEWDMWLIQSLAQELIFTGFIFGCLGVLFGEPSQDPRGAFAPAMWLTAVIFALWHLVNWGVVSDGYVAFQLLYTFLGGWWTLNLRRWTGSLWPGVANHIVVNYLATVV